MKNVLVALLLSGDPCPADLERFPPHAVCWQQYCLLKEYEEWCGWQQKGPDVLTERQWLMWEDRILWARRSKLAWYSLVTAHGITEPYLASTRVYYLKEARSHVEDEQWLSGSLPYLPLWSVLEMSRGRLVPLPRCGD